MIIFPFVIRDFISLIFPQNCINCQQSLISEEKYLCTACKIDLPLTNDHKNTNNDLFAKFAFEPKVMSATSFFYFIKEGITQKLLHEVKYKGKKELAILLGSMFAPYLENIKVDLITPIPLHKSKLRKRTFNQSEKISQGISNELDVEVNSQLIQRLIATNSQTRKAKVERWKNMRNVYSEAQTALSGKSVLVVDDVITTGATIGMFCQRLVEADVKEIHIASIARGK